MVEIISLHLLINSFIRRVLSFSSYDALSSVPITIKDFGNHTKVRNRMGKYKGIRLFATVVYGSFHYLCFENVLKDIGLEAFF